MSHLEPKIWVVSALKNEIGNLPSNIKHLAVGVGKLNAGLKLMKAIKEAQQKPILIINAGAAGSGLHPQGKVVFCTHFIQHDFTLGPLEETLTGFNPEIDTLEALQKLGLGSVLEETNPCYTGDRFVTESLPYHAIDMEAYALAKAAQLENIPFLAIKFISDGADHEAAKSFSEIFPQVAPALGEAIDRVVENLVGEG